MRQQRTLQDLQHRLQPPGKAYGLYRRNRERLRRAREEGIPADAAGRRLSDERRHREARGRMRLQAALELARRHRRIHEVVQERQEPAEVGQISAKKSAKEGLPPLFLRFFC